MDDRVPTFVMLVPGPWGSAADVVRTLRAADVEAHPRSDGKLAAGDVEVDLIEDPALASAFAYGREGRLSDDLRQRIQKLGRAALIEVALRLDRDRAAVAEIGKALRNAGGVAIRMELSGGCSSLERWLEQVESGSIAALYHCAVVIVGDGGSFFTCGMHHFDRPDAEIGVADPGQAIAWLDAFHLYQLLEDPVLAPGQTFRPDEESPRRVIERWPDPRHDAGDGRHNPFGLWRFLAEGVAARTAPMLVPTIIPPLVALLTAQERELGRPLVREEVERLTAASAAVAISRRDAISLERARGYADIDPELAWDQWQIVRAGMLRLT